MYLRILRCVPFCDMSRKLYGVLITVTFQCGHPEHLSKDLLFLLPSSYHSLETYYRTGMYLRIVRCVPFCDMSRKVWSDFICEWFSPVPFHPFPSVGVTQKEPSPVRLHRSHTCLVMGQANNTTKRPNKSEIYFPP